MPFTAFYWLLFSLSIVTHLPLSLACHIPISRNWCSPLINKVTSPSLCFGHPLWWLGGFCGCLARFYFTVTSAFFSALLSELLP